MKIEDFLSINAETYSDKTAVTDGKVGYTYSELYRCVTERKQQYDPYKGSAIVFRNSQDAEFVINYFAIHAAGCVAVPLAEDCPEAQFKALGKALEGEAFGDKVADILFTTGTTGASKGVMISHDTIVANAENLVEAQGFKSGLTFIICGPLNHIGSLSKIYPSIMAGATIHILDGIKNMDAFFNAIDCSPYKVASFMVPATIKMVMALDHQRLSAVAQKVDFIETGADAIAESDMHRLASLLPEARLFNTYASTETGIISTHDFNHDICVAGCLGRAMKNSHIEISQAGKVVCSGRTIMLGYWNDKELTDSILYEGAIHTNDLGRLDESGRLHLTGRDNDLINIGGYKIAPTEVERAALTVDGVADCICIAFHHKVLGNVLKLLVVPEPDRRPSFKEIAASLKRQLEGHKVPQQYEYVEKIERTFNGKLNRKAYRE